MEETHDGGTWKRAITFPRSVSLPPRSLGCARTRAMHLYLGDNPRTLYLATSQHDEKLGRPQRVLVFRVSSSNPSQAIVEFLPKDQTDLSSAILITNRAIKGCMGLINVGRGEPVVLTSNPSSADFRSTHVKRSLSPSSLLPQRSETLVPQQALRNRSLGSMKSASTAYHLLPGMTLPILSKPGTTRTLI